MKRLSLRTEHLGELSSVELQAVAGAAGADVPGTISDGSCVCTFSEVVIRAIRCDISDGSCVCTGQTR